MNEPQQWRKPITNSVQNSSFCLGDVQNESECFEIEMSFCSDEIKKKKNIQLLVIHI